MMNKKNIRKIAVILCAFLLLCVFPVVAFATGGAIDSYADYTRSEDLFSSLDDDTKELLKDFGVTDVEINELYNVGFSRVLDSFLDLLTGSLKDKAFLFASLMGVLIIISIISAVSEAGSKRGVELAGYCVLALVAGVSFISLISVVESVFVSSLNFMKTFIPIYAAVIAASGKPVLALSFNTAVLALGEFIVYFVKNIYAPFTGMICCIAFTSGISDFIDSERILSGIRKGITFVLGLAASLFSGLLSIKSVLASSADSVSAKGVRFLIGSSVPIVGGSVSEAYGSILAGLSLVKSTVGVFGIISIFAIFLPVIVEIIAWLIILSFTGVLSKALGCNKESGLLNNLSSCVSLLFAGTAITLAVLIISCGVILKIA